MRNAQWHFLPAPSTCESRLPRVGFPSGDSPEMSLAFGQQGYRLGDVTLEVRALLMRLEGVLIVVDFVKHDPSRILRIDQDVELTAAGLGPRFCRILQSSRYEGVDLPRLNREMDSQDKHPDLS